MKRYVAEVGDGACWGEGLANCVWKEPKMNYYLLDPEVPGGMGHDTVIEPAAGGRYLPHVEVLHIEIAGWMGDDLLQDFPCYMVTERLKKALESSELCGFEIANMKVTIGEQSLMFRDSMFTSWPFPQIHWLKISGVAGSDDFGLTPLDAPVNLVVSARAMTLLRSFQLDTCEISDYETTSKNVSAQKILALYSAVHPEKAGHVISVASSAASGSDCLQIEMTTYLGSELVQVDKEFIVTSAVRDKLDQAGCTGYQLGCVAASLADPTGTNHEEFARYGVRSNQIFPEFHHLRIEGTLGLDDLSLDKNGSLIVSLKVVEQLKKCFLPTCLFIDYVEL